MAKQHNIPITNGIGSLHITNGNYTATATATGYDASTLTPAEVEIVEGTEEYSFTVAATGTLTLHVSDGGSDIGVPIIGATFHRCDAEGNTYGDVITTDDEGNAVFANVPFGDADTPATIYFKQITSDGEHEFSGDLQTASMDAETKTIEIQNSEAATKNFKLTDANYENLPIADGEITLEEG